MNARHVTDPTNPHRYGPPEPCPGLDPVWQQTLEGGAVLVCAACHRPCELLPEPVSLWRAELAPGVSIITDQEPRS